MKLDPHDTRLSTPLDPPIAVYRITHALLNSGIENYTTKDVKHYIIGLTGRQLSETSEVPRMFAGVVAESLADKAQP